MGRLAVAEDIHVIQIHPAIPAQWKFSWTPGRRLPTPMTLDMGVRIFQPARHGGGQAASPDGDVRARSKGPSAHDHFIRQRSLSGHGHQVVIRMDKSAAVGFAYSWAAAAVSS